MNLPPLGNLPRDSCDHLSLPLANHPKEEEYQQYLDQSRKHFDGSHSNL